MIPYETTPEVQAILKSDDPLNEKARKIHAFGFKQKSLAMDGPFSFYSVHQIQKMIEERTND